MKKTSDWFKAFVLIVAVNLVLFPMLLFTGHEPLFTATVVGMITVALGEVAIRLLTKGNGAPPSPPAAPACP
ncbi:hypothetical protein M8C13_08735 [Crossiella sp. SN42]|uniref:hypothetical protein n=1 Tax=Crossiella sp. SN42 TaxID=2944808 RepID=UPI00207C19CB|nr:hypothetical protein [Crossiella sp. SN42]MCO1575841.1 hypothetical protein [Crossiella sp. SN42]